MKWNERDLSFSSFFFLLSSFSFPFRSFPFLFRRRRRKKKEEERRRRRRRKKTKKKEEEEERRRRKKKKKKERREMKVSFQRKGTRGRNALWAGILVSCIHTLAPKSHVRRSGTRPILKKCHWLYAKSSLKRKTRLSPLSSIPGVWVLSEKSCVWINSTLCLSAINIAVENMGNDPSID